MNMKLQRYEEVNERIREEFERQKQSNPSRFKRHINVSFCSQMFGLEKVTDSIERLARLGYKYIEIPGNYGGPDVGNHTRLKDILRALDDNGMKCSGVCPYTFEPFALHAFNYFHRQNAVDYVKANVEFCQALGGSYYLITPSAVRAPGGLDKGDWDRSVWQLREVADIFVANGIKCAVEPVSLTSASIVHNFEEAKRYIEEVGHAGVKHIYGDLEHMWNGERHIGQSIMEAGDMLLNLHLRDTFNKMPIGNGMIDIDTVIRTLYLIGFNEDGRYVVGEPTAYGYEPDKNGSLFCRYSEHTRMAMARETLDYFREREGAVLSGV